MSITSIPTVVPNNKYSFSDAFGGSSDPFTASDPDALISQDLEGEPWIRHSREFDVLGREGSVRHLLRLLISVHDRQAYLRWKHLYTGVLVNHQEDGRLVDGQNGHEFYVAETDKNIRVVVSPLDDLASIKERVKTLQRLPNANSLFSPTEQFRSKKVPILLVRNYYRYEQELVDTPTNAIPDDPRCGLLRATYVDRYGNVLVWKEEGIEKECEELRTRIGKVVGVRFGDRQLQEVHVTDSLSHALNGRLNVYPNGENIDFAGKWNKGYTEEDKREHSAFTQLGKPVENVTPVHFEW